MSTRRRAREAALQALFQLDQAGPPDADWIRQFVAGRLRRPELTAFAMDLIEGTRRCLPDLDRRIAQVAEHWSLDRMPSVDRNILRLAAFELLYHGQTPVKVVLDEAIELAKRFSTGQSAAFVNAVLDRLRQPPEETGTTPLPPIDSPPPTKDG